MSNVTRNTHTMHPSTERNTINGYNTVPCCNSDNRTDIFLVFPNLGYGFVASILAKTGRDVTTMRPEVNFTYARDAAEGNVDILTIEKTESEYITPLTGTMKEMFVARIGLGDICQKEARFDEPIILPLPLRILPKNSSAFLDALKQHPATTLPQAALFDLARQISDNTYAYDITDSNDHEVNYNELLKEAIASEIMRCAGDTLTGSSAYKWTGSRDGIQDRLEFMHQFTVKDYYDYIVDRHGLDRVFLSPGCLILMKNDRTRSCRLYYNRTFSERLFSSIVITGKKHPPEITVTTSVIVPEKPGTAPSWISDGTWADIVESGLPQCVADIASLADNGDRSDWIPAAFTSPLSGITVVRYDDGEPEEQTAVCSLVTFRPPVFTAGDLYLYGDTLLLPFSASYLLPFGSFEGTPAGFMNADAIDDHLYLDKSVISGDLQYALYHDEWFTRLAFVVQHFFAMLRRVTDILIYIASAYIDEDTVDETAGRLLTFSPSMYMPVSTADAIGASEYFFGTNLPVEGGVLPSDTVDYAVDAPDNHPADSTALHRQAVSAINATTGRSTGSILSLCGTVHPYVVSRAATKITPSTDDEQDNVTVTYGACLGDGQSSNTADLMQHGAGADLDDLGFINVASLFSYIAGGNKEEAVKLIITLCDALPQVAADVCIIAKNTIIHMTHGVIEDCVYRTDFEQNTITYGSIDLIGVLVNIEQICTANATEVDASVGDMRQRLWNAIEDLKKYYRNEEVPAISIIAEEVAYVLRYCLTLCSSIRPLIMGVSGTSYSFYAEESKLPASCLIDVAAQHNGLGFYNLRKSYLVFLSALSFLMSVMERIVLVAAELSYGTGTVFQIPDPVGTAVPLVLYSFADANRNPVFPNLEEECSITGITGIRLNSITRLFPEDSLYYDITARIPACDEAPADAVFFPGFGIADDTGVPDLPAQYPYYWEEQGSGETNIADLYIERELAADKDELNTPFRILQHDISQYDFIGRSANNYIWIYQGDDVPVTSTVSVTSIQNGIGDSNMMTMIPEKPFHGKIDSTYVMPFTGKSVESYSVNFSLDIGFKLRQPMAINITTGAYELPDKVFTDYTAVTSQINAAATSLYNYITAGKVATSLASKAKTVVIPISGNADPSISTPFWGESALLAYTFEAMGSPVPVDLKTRITNSLSRDTWHTEIESNDPNYNIFLSKRRAFVIMWLLVQKLIDIAKTSGGKQISGTSQWITIAEYDDDTHTAKYTWEGTDYTVTHSIAPFRCYGFGSLFADCAANAMLVATQFQGHRRSIVSLQEIPSGSVTNHISYASPTLTIKYPVSSTSGTVVISNNSPYLPKFSNNVVGTRVSTDVSQDTFIKYYTKKGAVLKAAGLITSLPSDIQKALTVINTAAVEAKISKFIADAIKSDGDTVFQFKESFKNKRIIIYTRS